MKATFRIVTPAAASAVAAILLTACADKPVHVPGGVFVEEPYTGESVSGSQTQPQTQPETQTIPAGDETYETDNIFIEDDIPVGPVEGGSQAGQQVQPIEQESASKANAPEGSVEYKVVKGDTLWGIGMVYGVSVARLAEINGIDEKTPLKIGQVLMIPPDAKNAVGKPIPQKKTEPAKTDSSSTKASTSSTTKSSSASTAKPVAKDGETLYVVKKGDSLSVIAQRHHVKLADLVAANKIDQNAILRIGQTLVIPAAGSKAASSTTAKSSATASTAKTDSKTDTKPAGTSAATTTKTEPAKTQPAATTTQKGGEGTGGVVEPIGGSSSGAVSTPAAQTSVGASDPALDPVSALPDTDVISIPIDFESTLEELSGILERDLNDLVRLNPEFKPGQKIPAGTAVRMPLF